MKHQTRDKQLEVDTTIDAKTKTSHKTYKVTDPVIEEEAKDAPTEAVKDVQDGKVVEIVPKLNVLSEKVKSHKIFQNFNPKKKTIIAKEQMIISGDKLERIENEFSKRQE